jgi:hypothetical protein
MAVHKRFGGQVTEDDIANCQVMILLSEKGAIVGIEPHCEFSVEDVADALHVLSHKLYNSIEQWHEEAEKN